MKDPFVSPLLLNSVNCYYLVLNREQKVMQYNPRFQQLFTGAILTDTPFTSLIPAHLHKHWHYTVERLLQNDKQVESFIASIDPGNIIHWELMNDDAGNIQMIGARVQGGASEEGDELKSVLKELEKIMMSSLDIICTLDEEGRFVTLSEACKYILGYSPRELINGYFLSKVHPGDVARTLRAAEGVKLGFNSRDLENRLFHKDGHLVPITWSMKWDEADRRFYGIGRDITHKKKAEQVLKDSEEKYKLLFYRNPLPMWIHEEGSYRFLEVNEAALKTYGYTHDEFMNMTIFDITSEEDKQKLQGAVSSAAQAGEQKPMYWQQERKDGSLILVELAWHQLEYEGKRAKLVLATDRTVQIQAQQEIIKTNERFNYVTKAAQHVIWDWDMENNEILWNNVLFTMLGHKAGEATDYTWWQNHLHPNDRDRVVKSMSDHLASKKHHWEQEYRFSCADGSYLHILDRGFTIYDENEEPHRMIGTMQDVTDLRANEVKLKELNASLEKRARELAESNAELERFAYVASHDLQEPLRMVSSFLQLIEKRYKDKLDQKGHEYIAFAVDGAERMKSLILDLLEYSRVNTSSDEKEEVDTKALVDNVRLVYQNVLQETGGTITSSGLPVVRGNKTQLTQLFQNLVGNALKYRSTSAPEIDISCSQREHYYRFEVADNGIGIDEKYFQKIFVIFQRLHNREQYRGTGIGLAICKKIVERHGGTIGLSSTVGEGSRFYFTLPY